MVSGGVVLAIDGQTLAGTVDGGRRGLRLAGARGRRGLRPAGSAAGGARGKVAAAASAPWGRSRAGHGLLVISWCLPEGQDVGL
jgi:hypothetical protein